MFTFDNIIMIHPSHSLVKYDNPVLVSKTQSEKQAPGAAANSPTKPSSTDAEKNKLQAGATTEDILNSILPPR